VEGSKHLGRGRGLGRGLRKGTWEGVLGRGGS